MNDFERELIKFGRQIQAVSWIILVIGLVVFWFCTIQGVGLANHFSGIAVLSMCLFAFWHLRKDDEELEQFEAHIDHQDNRMKDWQQNTSSEASKKGAGQ